MDFMSVIKLRATIQSLESASKISVISGLWKVPVGYQQYLNFYECQQVKSHNPIFGKCQQDISHI